MCYGGKAGVIFGDKAGDSNCIATWWNSAPSSTSDPASAVLIGPSTEQLHGQLNTQHVGLDEGEHYDHFSHKDKEEGHYDKWGESGYEPDMEEREVVRKTARQHAALTHAERSAVRAG
eukprot:gene15125-biopygen13488